MEHASVRGEASHTSRSQTLNSMESYQDVINERLAALRERMTATEAAAEQYQYQLLVTQERLQRALGGVYASATLPVFPFGTDLTQEEVALADSLRQVKELAEDPGEFVYTMLRALVHRVDEHKAEPFLKRIGLQHPNSRRRRNSGR